MKSFSIIPLIFLLSIIGPEDTALWPAAMKEQEDWLNSKESNAGVGLYRAVEEKIMAELPKIKRERQIVALRRRQLVTHYRSLLLSTMPRNLTAAVNATMVELETEQSTYTGDSDSDDRVYVYLASDNERVKAAIAEYLLGHKHIAIMRVKSDHHIVHAKNIGYLKRNSTGVMNLVLDWYCMSLSNVIFAWRRDTTMLSTFAQVNFDLEAFILLHSLVVFSNHRVRRECPVMEIRLIAISTDLKRRAETKAVVKVLPTCSEQGDFNYHSGTVEQFGRTFKTLI